MTNYNVTYIPAKSDNPVTVTQSGSCEGNAAARVVAKYRAREVLEIKKVK